MNFEHWRLINGYSNYEVSSEGRVRNNGTDRILKPGTLTQGYYFVNLSKQGKHRNHLIHILVGDAFIPNPKHVRCIDHKNGDKTDNRLENLRRCTQSQNIMNSAKRKNASSQYKGVTWDKKANTWRAQIVCNKKISFLGYFKKEEDGARAYDRKARELFMEFARTNFAE